MDDTYLTLPSGDDRELEIAVTDPDDDDAPVDLTDCDLWFYVKVRKSDADADALVQKTTSSGITITDAVGGIAEVSIDAVDTASIPGGLYRWELQAKDLDDDVTTLAKGWIRIEGDLIVSS